MPVPLGGAGDDDRDVKSLGRASRKGTVGAFNSIAGTGFTWMGAFVGWCATGIMFYYSVVTMWCFYYMGASMTGMIRNVSGQEYWNRFETAYVSKTVLLACLIVFCFFVLFKGVVRGIERLNRYLVPGLLIILIIGAVRSVTLPGALEGVAYMLTPRWEDFFHYRTWLEAVTQAAWSTGAGWGLLLTYGAYMHSKENIGKTSVVTRCGRSVRGASRRHGDCAGGVCIAERGCDSAY